MFVFKGTFVAAATIDAVKRLGAVAINVYPDVSFTMHGALIPKALPRYDYILTTKSYGVADLAREIGVTRASFLPHGYDPETHFPVVLDAREAGVYGSDAAFVGSWSPKKEALLRHVRERLPRLDLKIWGEGWGRASGLAGATMGRSVLGREYAKAITGAKINIALLSDATGEASSGDLTTTRTFEIPAVGGFMLHERTAEAQGFFAEGRDCAMFGDAEELVTKIAHFLAHPQQRLAMAQAGHARCLASGYSVDDRAASRDRQDAGHKGGARRARRRSRHERRARRSAAALDHPAPSRLAGRTAPLLRGARRAAHQSHRRQWRGLVQRCVVAALPAERDAGDLRHRRA